MTDEERKGGFFTCAGSSPQSTSAPLRPVEILHEEYNIQLYVGTVKSKSSPNFSQVSVSSESEIFAFRSGRSALFQPLLCMHPQTPNEIPPIVVKRLFKSRTKAFPFEV